MAKDYRSQVGILYGVANKFGEMSSLNCNFVILTLHICSLNGAINLINLGMFLDLKLNRSSSCLLSRQALGIN